MPFKGSLRSFKGILKAFEGLLKAHKALQRCPPFQNMLARPLGQPVLRRALSQKTKRSVDITLSCSCSTSIKRTPYQAALDPSLFVLAREPWPDRENSLPFLAWWLGLHCFGKPPLCQLPGP